MCEYNFAFNLFSPLFPSLARSLAKIPTAVDRLSLPLPPPAPRPRPPCTPLVFSRSPFSAFSLALLLRVSFRFFHSEPSLPPLTFVGEVAPSDSLLQPHLSPLPSRTFTTLFNLFAQPCCCPFLFVLNTPFLFPSIAALPFLSVSLSLSFHRPSALFLSFLALSYCHPSAPLASRRSLAVVIIKHCESQRH